MSTNWAQRGKEALSTVSAVPEGYTRIAGGNGEEIVTFYRFTKATNPDAKTGLLVKGDRVEGVYAGYYENKKFGNIVHKVRTEKGLVALPTATQLANALKGVTEGTKVLIIYNGKAKIKTGKFAGKDAHTFEVFSA